MQHLKRPLHRLHIRLPIHTPRQILHLANSRAWVRLLCSTRLRRKGRWPGETSMMASLSGAGSVVVEESTMGAIAVLRPSQTDCCLG